ncbi:type IIB DNA topoisomerase [Naegleria gruberi]|uniref:DNA topoisomerase (ATP-hydrolyzing) n=1 Tax=Naegleria gruberi TaxID=5762 RepID=D2VKE9_NAEGR|nr:type IIB DNA topoisomerase [Naegleria gruberi]EFC42675.1 type IIB DNA topoisomerase [Naegleria gruberi]|eukprot:XP_002675419.1 type IIB DNA topoisomerase [Naegleria gruberi strain NEG-M]
METIQVRERIEEKVLAFVRELVSSPSSDIPNEKGFLLKDLTKYPSTFISKFQVMNLVYQLCTLNKFSTKRDLYYCNKPILKDQTQLDSILKDLSSSWRVNRHDLHIVPQSKGEVCGPIAWKEISLIDIENRGQQPTTTIVSASKGCNLPSIPHLQIVEFSIPVEVDKVIIVEKESVFQVLKSQASSLKDTSLIITSKGYPDVPTRDFIVTLTKQVAKYQRRSLNIFTLTDGDPYGAEIANVYMNGSLSFENEKENLTIHSCVDSTEDWHYWVLQTCSRMSWIGVHLNDFDNAPQLISKWKDCWMPLEELDLKKINSLNNTQLELDDTVKTQINLQKDLNYKVEIEESSETDSDYCEAYGSDFYDDCVQLHADTIKTSDNLQEFILDAQNKGGSKFTQCGALDSDFGLPGLQLKLDNEQFKTIGFPLSNGSASELIQFCSKAPYGRGEDTIYDENVRKTWQLDPSRFEITNPTWDDLIDGLVDNEIRDGLGISKHLRLSANLYKLLVYEEGGHFQFHKDSEKEERMFGTLVVQLPSEYSGGEIIVRHGEEEEEYDFASVSRYTPHFISFYADCEHMIKNVNSGYRVCLIYNLCFSGNKESKPTLKGYEELAKRLQQIVSEWNADAKDVDTLYRMYVFQHQYSQKSLDPENLKGSDYNIYDILERYAEEYQDLVLDLGIMERKVEGFDDPEVSLEYIFGSQQRKIDVPFRSVVCKSALSSMKLFHKSINENTGNEGSTKEKQYRNACLMIYPKKCQQRICLKFGFSFCSKILPSFIESNSRENSIAFVKQMLAKKNIYLWGDEEKVVIQSIIQLNDVELAKLVIGIDQKSLSSLISHFTIEPFRETISENLCKKRYMKEFIGSLIEINDVPLIQMTMPKYSVNKYDHLYDSSCFEKLIILAQKCTYSMHSTVVENIVEDYYKYASYKESITKLIDLLKDTSIYEKLIVKELAKNSIPNQRGRGSYENKELDLPLIIKIANQIGVEKLKNLRFSFSKWLTSENCLNMVLSTMSCKPLSELLIEWMLYDHRDCFLDLKFATSFIRMLHNHSWNDFITRACRVVLSVASEENYSTLVAPLIEVVSNIMPKSDQLDILLNWSIDLIDDGIRTKKFIIPLPNFSVKSSISCICSDCKILKQFLWSETERTCSITGLVKELSHIESMVAPIREIQKQRVQKSIILTKLVISERLVKQATELNNAAKTKLESLLKKRRTPPEESTDNNSTLQLEVAPSSSIEPPNKKSKTDAPEIICIDD